MRGQALRRTASAVTRDDRAGVAAARRVADERGELGGLLDGQRARRARRPS